MPARQRSGDGAWHRSLVYLPGLKDLQPRKLNQRVKPLVNDALEDRIETQEEWTFTEVLGLSAEFGMKPRMIISLLFASGKRYVDGEGLPSADKPPRG